MEGGQAEQEQRDGRALSRELPHDSRKSPPARGTLAVEGRPWGLVWQVGVSPCCLGRPACLCGHSHLLSVTHGCRRGWPVAQPSRLIWQEQMVLHFGVFCSEWALWGWNGQGCAGSGCLSDRYVFCFRVAGANPPTQNSRLGHQASRFKKPLVLEKCRRWASVHPEMPPPAVFGLEVGSNLHGLGPRSRLPSHPSCRSGSVCWVSFPWQTSLLLAAFSSLEGRSLRV